MLDYTKKLTSEEIWWDCFTERLMEIMAHLQRPNLLPERLHFLAGRGVAGGRLVRQAPEAPPRETVAGSLAVRVVHGVAPFGVVIRVTIDNCQSPSV